MPADAPPAAGLTVAEVARRYRVSPDKVRAWVARGELAAVNTGTHRRPRLVVLPHQLAEFERRRSATPTPTPPVRRRRPALTDFYPD
jgi:excisionase family DNA binding protein